MKKEEEILDRAKQIVDFDVLLNVSSFVEYCLSESVRCDSSPDCPVTLDDLTNHPNYCPQNGDGDVDENGEFPEILQWWAVTPYLGRKLESEGEIVLDVDTYKVWGRTTAGQSVWQDDVFFQIAKKQLEGK